MAGVQWAKFTGHGAVKAVLRHNCKDSREAQQNHSNKQLDTSRTHLNYGLHHYADACKRYDERIAELAPKSVKRKDQVTGLGLEFPVPKDLPRKQYKAWFGRTVRLLREQFGEENLVDFQVHFDEEHEYLHHETGELTMSRVHGHATVVPDHEGRLCAKKVYTKGNVNKLNNAIEQMSVSEFGVHFMDGKGKGKKGKRVEDLKRLSSAKLAELAEELADKEAALDERERALDAREASLQRRERVLEAAKDAPAKSAAASPAAPRKSGVRSLASIRQQTHASARTVDGYAVQGYEKGR